jgi:uncharacterized membrane protein HdeD (DUF308 family)
MSENNSSQQNSVESNETTSNKVDRKKPGFFTLLIGLFLIIRGAMRVYEGDLGIMGIIMIAVGIGSIVYYFVKK